MSEVKFEVKTYEIKYECDESHCRDGKWQRPFKTLTKDMFIPALPVTRRS